MIAKNIKGKSFKGCVSYVMNKESVILESDGVLTDNTQGIIHSFAMQRLGRPEIKQPVGHIPIAFSPKDKRRMTDDFMVQLAKEYMQEMGISNTQYIIVRHYNTDNPHLHIVYNRINNDLKLISVNHDYKRNIKVCKRLKDNYGLTYGEGKEKVKREKLENPDKVKYQIYDTIRAMLPYCKTPNELKLLLEKFGVETNFKLKRTTNEIEGISFRCEDISFKGSEIDRKFSFANLQKEFGKNSETQKKQVEKQPEKPENKSQTDNKKFKYSTEQLQILREGGFIYIEDVPLKNGSKASGYLFFDEKMTKPFFTRQQPDSFVKYGKYEMRLMDKMRIEAGFMTKAKVKWYGGGFAQPYLWKENKSDTEYKESWGNPRIAKEEKVEKRLDISKEIKKNVGRKI